MKTIGEVQGASPQSIAATVLVGLFFTCGVTSLFGQQPADAVHIHQIAASSHSDDPPDPITSQDREATALWPQLACRGLETGGVAGDACALSTPASLPGSDGNAATIVQRGSHNSATLIQRGAGNVAVMTQTGSWNEVSAEQRGNDNLIGIRLVGHDNSLDVLQNGNDNAYLFSFAGDDLDHSVEQRGHDLQLIQLGQGTLPFSVEQQGTGMTVRIEHNPLSPWPR